MQLKLRSSLLLAGIILMFLMLWLPLSEKSQVIFMIISFILFGIPHGALDISIEEGLQKKANTRKIFLQYVALAFFYVFLWYLVPVLAFIIFILVTAFHFGDIDWIGPKNGRYSALVYFTIGLSWILFLLSYNASTALGIFSAITRQQINQEYLLQLARVICPTTIAILIVTYLFLYLKRRQYFGNSFHWYISIIQTTILLGLALAMPLWTFFGFYFGIWHSILSLDKIRAFFELKFTTKDWILLFKRAMPFSVMAWIGILYFILLTQKSSDPNGILSLIFIGLAVLTGPHLIVFAKLNKSRSAG